MFKEYLLQLHRQKLKFKTTIKLGLTIILILICKETNLHGQFQIWHFDSKFSLAFEFARHSLFWTDFCISRCVNNVSRGKRKWSSWINWNLIRAGVDLRKTWPCCLVSMQILRCQMLFSLSGKFVLPSILRFFFLADTNLPVSDRLRSLCQQLFRETATAIISLGDYVTW